MQKYFLIGLLLLYFLQAASQSDRKKIGSLKKALPLLHDSTRVDCLNELSRLYVPEKWEDQLLNDTCEYYATFAYNESKKLNYNHGMAEALSLKVEIRRKMHDMLNAEKFAREAIFLFSKTPNKKGLIETYYSLAIALHAQSRFKEALKPVDSCRILSEKAGDTYHLFYSALVNELIYVESGNYEKGFEKASVIQQLALKYNNENWKRIGLSLLGDLYYSIHDYNTALSFYRQTFQGAKPPYKDHNVLDFAGLFSINKQFDSAKYYYSFADTTTPRSLRFYLVSKGEYYFLLKQYDTALALYLRGLNYNNQFNDRNQVMNALMCIAEAYDSVHNYTSAYKFAREGLDLALETGARQHIRNGYQILYSVYDHRHQTDSAYYYYRLYNGVNDSLLTDQFKGKLAGYHYLQRIALLDKEQKIQQQQLKQEAFVKRVLMGGLAGLVLISLIIIRNFILKRRNEAHRREIAENELQIQKLESEKKTSAYHQQKIELEMQALRAQMNPHFIFNCLNAINHFIFKNETETAFDFLTKFSRLIRMVLQSSSKKYISLAEELETLSLYVELEQMRFRKHFSYSIHYDEAIDAEAILIPPMLLQPFVENAIWHGLMHKEEDGNLSIDIAQQDQLLRCTITDNGIGRLKAAALKSKSASYKKSMGMQITASRLQLLNEEKDQTCFLNIIDLKDEKGNYNGTKVIIHIPVSFTESVVEKEVL